MVVESMMMMTMTTTMCRMQMMMIMIKRMQMWMMMMMMQMQVMMMRRRTIMIGSIVCESGVDDDCDLCGTGSPRADAMEVTAVFGAKSGRNRRPAVRCDHARFQRTKDLFKCNGCSGPVNTGASSSSSSPPSCSTTYLQCVFRHASLNVR